MRSRWGNEDPIAAGLTNGNTFVAYTSLRASPKWRASSSSIFTFVRRLASRPNATGSDLSAPFSASSEGQSCNRTFSSASTLSADLVYGETKSHS